MGEALVPFAGLEEAKAYVTQHGGRIYKFDDISMEMLRPDRHANSHLSTNSSKLMMKNTHPD